MDIYILWCDTTSRNKIIKNLSMEQNIPVEKMYEQRQNFTIVALTGITGSKGQVTGHCPA